MKKISIVVISLFLFVSDCFATPSIISLVGKIAKAETLILTCTSAGTKSPAAPFRYESFESGMIAYDDWDWEYGTLQYNSLSLASDSNGNFLQCNIYSYSNSNLTLFDQLDDIYIFYKFKKHWTWGPDGNYAYGKVKVNRMKSDATGPNEYFEFDSSSYIKSVVEFGTSGTEYYAFDLTTIKDDVWYTQETWCKITEDNSGVMQYTLNNNTIINRTGVDSDIATLYVKACGFARVRELGILDTDRYWLDDVYIDITQARVMLGNNPVFTSCTHREIQIPTEWSDTEISFTFNQGSFNNGDTVYLFVIDSDGNASEGYPITIGGTSLNTSGTLEYTGSLTID